MAPVSPTAFLLLFRGPGIPHGTCLLGSHVLLVMLITFWLWVHWCHTPSLGTHAFVVPLLRITHADGDQGIGWACSRQQSYWNPETMLSAWGHYWEKMPSLHYQAGISRGALVSSHTANFFLLLFESSFQWHILILNELHLVEFVGDRRSSCYQMQMAEFVD